MEFFFAVFFLLFYYIRPQDWVPGLSGMNLVQPIIGIWILVLFFGRSKPSPLPGFLKTPHDWVLLAYLAYIVLFANGPIMAILPFFAFYFLTVQSLTSWDRVLRYLKFWTIALFAVACIASLSTVGLDLTGAQSNRFTQVGRLAINTWLHNNPNALAHSVVIILPMSYVLFFWQRGLLSKMVSFTLFSGVAFYCAWQTQSKGAYLVGAVTLLFALIIGRPRWLQVLALSLALTVGISALSFLPRMGEMNNLRSDEGVQGRLIAWEMARTTERNHPTGVGWKQFIAEIPWKEGEQYVVVRKATHSSYVQVGADLGRYGLFLYLACIWCCFHTLLVVKSEDITQERCRRLLLILLLANVLSGWMINRQYHTEYFLILAAVAAVHRLKKANELAPGTSKNPSDEEDPKEKQRSKVRALQAAWRGARLRKRTPTSPDVAAPTVMGKSLWNRFGFLDLTLCAGLTWLTFWTWDYLMRNV
jgi:hypothetical protein